MSSVGAPRMRRRPMRAVRSGGILHSIGGYEHHPDGSGPHGTTSQDGSGPQRSRPGLPSAPRADLLRQDRLDERPLIAQDAEPRGIALAPFDDVVLLLDALE